MSTVPPGTLSSFLCPPSWISGSRGLEVLVDSNRHWWVLSAGGGRVGAQRVSLVSTGAEGPSREGSVQSSVTGKEREGGV